MRALNQWMSAIAGSNLRTKVAAYGAAAVLMAGGLNRCEVPLATGQLTEVDQCHLGGNMFLIAGRNPAGDLVLRYVKWNPAPELIWQDTLGAASSISVVAGQLQQQGQRRFYVAMRDGGGNARVIAGEAHGSGWDRLATAVGPRATEVGLETFGYDGVALVSYQAGDPQYRVNTYQLQGGGFGFVDSQTRSGTPLEFDTVRPFDPNNGKQFLVVALRTPTGDLRLDPFDITDGAIGVKFPLSGGSAEFVRATLGPPGSIVVAFRNANRDLQLNLYELEVCSYTAGPLSFNDYCLQRVTDNIASGSPAGEVFGLDLTTIGDDNGQTWNTKVATLILTNTWPKLVVWNVTGVSISRVAADAFFANTTGPWKLGVAGDVEKLLTTVSYTGAGNIGPTSLTTGWDYQP